MPMRPLPPKPEHFVSTKAFVKLVILADVRLYREGMRDSLALRPHLQVVGTASSVGMTCQLILETLPDVVVVDMATRGSREGVYRIRQAMPGLHVIGFGVDEEEHEILACAEAGLAGYVPCEASIDDLVDCIDCVSRGELRCTPKIAGMLFRHLDAVQRSGLPSPGTELTSREREVLGLIDGGMSNKEIAVRLRIEVSTVKNHVHNLLEKLHVTSRRQAAARLNPPQARQRRVAGAGLGQD